MAFGTLGRHGVDLTRVDSTAQFTVGTTEYGSDGNWYQYATATTAVAAYAAASISSAGAAAELTTTTSGAGPVAVGVPQVAVGAGSYGWFVRWGLSFTVLAAAGSVAGAKQYTTATAGVVDDTATDLIQGLTLTATVGGAQAATAATAVMPMCTNCQD